MIKKGQLIAITMIILLLSSFVLAVPAKVNATSETEVEKEETTNQNLDSEVSPDESEIDSEVSPDESEIDSCNTSEIEPDKKTSENNVIVPKKSENLFIEALDKKDVSIYDETTVKMGTIESTAEVQTNSFFPIYENVAVPVEFGSVIFHKMLVGEGSKVKKGTPIAKITTVVDPIQLEEKTINLKRLKEAYNNMINTQSMELKEQEKLIKSMTDEWDKKLANLELKKAKITYEIDKDTQERQIQDCKKEIDKLNAIKNTTEILAPVDGYVDSISLPKDGEETDYTKVLAKIIDPSKLLIEVIPDENSYPYNAKAQIHCLDDDTKEHYDIEGKVVGSEPSAEVGEESICTSYIKLEKKPSTKDALQMSYGGNIILYSMDNVPVISKDAVVNKNPLEPEETLYAYELKDGVQIERKFLPGLSDSNFVQILQGLEVGIKVAVFGKSVG